MTTLAPAASGMTIAAAGAGGVLTGQGVPAGLDGLFGMLMGGMNTGLANVLAANGPQGAVGDVPLGEAAPLGEMVIGPQGIQVTALTPLLTDTLPVTESVQLEDGAPVIEVSGDEEALKAFVAQLKEIYDTVVEAGGLTIGQMSDTTQLAGALEKMGMSPEEALGVAERIQTMLKLLEQQQKLDEETAGSLVAMMLAVMGQQVQAAPDGAVAEDAAAFGIQFVSVVDTVAPKSGGGAAKPAGWHVHVSGDIARDMLGLNAPVEAPVKDAVAGIPDEVTQKLAVEVVADANAAIGVVMPEVKTANVPVLNVPVAHHDAQPSVAAQAAATITTTGTAVKVMADEKIEAPKGETFYKLQADKQGVETLEAVKPMVEVRDPMLNTSAQAPAQAAATVATATTVDPSQAAAFAERVAQVQDMVEKAGVGKQVVVQMQPLLEQGGGTVRINLKPHELGSITVELTVREGKVHGAIAASEPAVMEQLARELHSLRHGLADAGLKLGEQGINLMLSNSNEQNQGQQGQGNRHAGRGHGAGAGSDAEGSVTANLAAWVAPDRVLDVNV